mmetsp:Transcript_9451/g.16202  ORF Transcript_9451/g.16202 Transcript_9451/m.16202 type:complete len:355 (+) Transcript_9451:390-1454(+)
MVSPPILQTQPSAIAAPEAPRVCPTLPIKRPTFGSFPATADLKSGPFTTALPTFMAIRSSSAPVTATRITCRVPSPLRTTCAARSRQSPRRAPRKVSGDTPETRPLEMRTVLSLVDSSPSTEMALKLSETASDRTSCISSRLSSLASVIKKHSMVAILGSIIPAPLAIPTSRAPFSNSLAANLGYRSVVMMPVAASNAPGALKSSKCGRASTISSTGKRQPMTPVELGKTHLPLGNCRFLANSSQILWEALTPPSSSGGETLLILLFTTRAWIFSFSRSRCRPSFTGAPGKAFWVKVAATCSEASSKQITVSFIGSSPISCASCGMNFRLLEARRNPPGSASCNSKEFKYSSSD